jgi:phosphoribosylanthranilate isomerase
VVVEVKLCGLATPDAVDAAMAGGARHLGFVFFPPSPRHLAVEDARALVARVPAGIGRVGVFVDPDDQLIAATRPFLDAAQLHRTAPARAAAIARQLPVWAAVAVKTRADLNAAAAYRGAAARIVYDARTPDGSALPGGMGLRFDWTLLQGFDHPLPWTLSGGLDATSIEQAVAATGARMVDVSSGIEAAPGVKDVDKIAAFLQAAARC